MEYHWIYKLHLRPGPIPDNRWPIQNELNDIFIVFLSHIALFGHFFCLIGLLPIYYGFQSCISTGFFLMCVFLAIFLVFECMFCLRARERSLGGRWEGSG